MPEHIASLADGAHYVSPERTAVLVSREVDDRVIRAVQGRANQRVHPGIDPHIGHVALGLDLGDADQERAGMRHQKAAGLHPERIAGVSRLEVRQRSVHGIEIEGTLLGLLCDPEASTQIQ